MRRNFSCGLVIVLVALVYYPALHNGFVYDDHGTIEENAFMARPANVARVLTLRTFLDPTVIDGQRPVLLLTHFIERAIWGVRPLGYHLTNILLHLACVALVFRFVGRLGLAPICSLTAALLFGLHPVLSEAVLVPSFREDILVTLFALCYVNAGARPVASTVFLALGLLSKESALVFPVLLAWYWMIYPAQRPPAKRAAGILLLGSLMAVLYLVVLQWGRGLQASSGIWNGYSLKWPANVLSAPCLFLEYIRLLLVPWPLSADRVFDPPYAVADLYFLAGAASVVAIVSLALLYRRPRPAVALGLGWILIAFVPVSNLVPLFNPMADRYLYLLAAGFAILLGSTIQRFTVIMLTAFYLAVLTLRVPDWKDDYTIWMKTGQLEPRSARAHTWIGLEMKRRGHIDVAWRHFRDADNINPQDVTALINLAILNGERGDLSAAEAQLREAVRRRPDKREAYENLAVDLRRQGKAAEADALTLP